ncbi:MAG: protein kinase [Fimbriimonas ginsengisoli]|uniref:non-specific serine/threonine protein kinase n=1 Tax=Fimbriimonas ginsengisoli TaxID=1005039 RepID=A0A931LZ80_FIMGI|nr:protein kinase [Fimbriimonas ginsengisoli]
MSANPPTTLGKYQIIREIARSNDIVYEAYDPLMNRRVAIKELATLGGATDQQRADRLKRFLREARAAGSLTHPNIMTVYEVGEDAGKHFIAMEYLDGHTLRNELDTKGFLPPDRAVEIVTAVLHGLDYAHTHGVIHRDIKPDNIQLLSDGRIKLTDFGIARLTFEQNITQDGQVFGTPSYMSPEQIVGREIDARSDLFSVGVVLYEMIAGQKPFQGDSVVAITYAIMNKEAERPTQANYALWQVIERSVDKSPGLRYTSAGEMLAAIEGAQRAVAFGPVIDPGHPALGATLYQPTPPPIVNPYASGQHVQPFPQPPPVQTPYLPAVNPYGPPKPGGHPTGYTPSSQIYYPPPPRKPLISPEVRYFVGRLFLAIVLVAMLIAVAVGLVAGVSKALSERAPPPQINSQNAKPSDVDAAISTLDNAETEDQKQATRQRIAEMLEQRAEHEGQTTQAEQDLHDALGYDETRAKSHRLLAELWDGRAPGVADPQQRISLLKGSVDEWVLAVKYERTTQLARIYEDRLRRARDRVGQECLAHASDLAKRGKSLEARQVLEDAIVYAENGSPSYGELRAALDQLSNRGP